MSRIWKHRAIVYEIEFDDWGDAKIFYERAEDAFIGCIDMDGLLMVIAKFDKDEDAKRFDEFLDENLVQRIGENTFELYRRYIPERV
jgi:hypothetical protein